MCCLRGIVVDVVVTGVVVVVVHVYWWVIVELIVLQHVIFVDAYVVVEKTSSIAIAHAFVPPGTHPVPKL